MAKKKTLLQRVKELFTGGGQETKKPAAKTTSTTVKMVKKEATAKAASGLASGKSTPMAVLKEKAQAKQTGTTRAQTAAKISPTLKQAVDAAAQKQRAERLQKAQAALKNATDRRSRAAASQQLRDAKYPLSPSDRKLDTVKRQEIQRQKARWDKGEELKKQGKTQQGEALQRRAHVSAEITRAGAGYSGGESGGDAILPEIGPGFQQLMTEEGKQNLRTQKRYYQIGQEMGDQPLMDAAHAAANAIRENPANYDPNAINAQLAKEKASQRYDAEGRRIYTPTKLEARAQASFFPAVGNQLAGSFLALKETAEDLVKVKGAKDRQRALEYLNLTETDP